MDRTRYSEKTKVMEVEGHIISVHVTNDIPDELLQMFFDCAINTENFEHAAAIGAEAEARNIKLNFS